MFSKKSSTTSKPKTAAKPAAPAPRTVTFTIPPRPRYSELRSSHRVRTGIVALAFITIAILGGFGGAYLHDQGDSAYLGSVSNEKKIVTNQSQLISQIAKRVGPSVVSVNVSITDNSASDNPYAQLFGQGGARTAEAAGTGIIISKNGLIVTNRHVVPVGTTKVSVTLSDGTELKDVEVVGRTNDTDTLDIAFLKITDAKGHKLSPAVIGDSSKVQVGDDAVAIGNALGQFQNTVTSGIISGFGRSVQAGDSGDQSAAPENLDNLFQTDAAINEGNSGGPLVNLNGQVIGINTAIAGGGAQNIGFAIPVNDIRGLIKQVLATGKFERPYLGVRYVPLTADVANSFNLDTVDGAYIAPAGEGAASSVLSGGPADAAGIKEGDILTAVDGKKIDATHSLTSLLAPHAPGDKVTITVHRDREDLKVEVTLGTLPAAQ